MKLKMKPSIYLTQCYGSFYWECTKFAAKPYTTAFKALASDPLLDTAANYAKGVIVIGMLTFIVPVLPIATSVTTLIAAVGILIAAASMLITYPFARGLDLIDSCANPSGRSYNSCEI